MAPPTPIHGSTVRTAATLFLAWLVAGIIAGVRLHLDGGVFGDRVPLVPSVATRLVEALPWAGAAGIAWWSAGRWRPSKQEILRPVTIHAWVGLATVVALQVTLAALRSAVVPPGLRPLDPWAALPAELTRRGPPALLVYGVMVAIALAWRAAPSDQEVPGAGLGDDESS